jgi:hypothetical protein
MHLLAGITGINNPSTKFTNPNTLVGDLVSRFILYATAFAGLIFFVKLVAAGFNLLTSVGDPGKIQSATKSLTNALIGLIVVISVYFLAQILTAVLGINQVL